MIRASIEGNIGVGKSTLIRYIKTHSICTIEEEPVHLWTNYNGVDVLAANYREPFKYGYHLQSLIIKTMTDQHRLKPRVMERSLTSSQYCFAEVMCESQRLSHIEYKMLEQQYTDSLREIELPNLIIYLRNSPDNIQKQIQLRNRYGESSITIDYLQQLHDKHEKWLMYRNHSERRPILILNQNRDFIRTNEIYLKIRPYLEGEKIISENQTIVLI